MCTYEHGDTVLFSVPTKGDPSNVVFGCIQGDEQCALYGDILDTNGNYTGYSQEDAVLWADIQTPGGCNASSKI